MTPAEIALQNSVKAFMGVSGSNDFTKVKVVQSPATQAILDGFQARKDNAVEVVLTARTSNPAGSGYYYEFQGTNGFQGRVFVDGATNHTGKFVFVYDNPVGSSKPIVRLKGGVTEVMPDLHFEQVTQEYKTLGKPSETSQAKARVMARRAVIELQTSGIVAAQEMAQLDRIEAAIKDGKVKAAEMRPIEDILAEMGLEVVAGVTI